MFDSSQSKGNIENDEKDNDHIDNQLEDSLRQLIPAESVIAEHNITEPVMQQNFMVEQTDSRHKYIEQ